MNLYLEGTLLHSFIFYDSSSEPIEVPVTSYNNNLTINNSDDSNIDNLSAANKSTIDSNNNAAPISTKNSNIEANENLSDKKRKRAPIRPELVNVQ